MDKPDKSPLDIFKKEIDNLCANGSEPCTKEDLHYAMCRLYEMLIDLHKN